MEQATSGHISVSGMDMNSQWSAIQQVLGLCPQHSILYPDLTVREHLIFYGRLKATLRDEDFERDIDE